MSAISSFVFFFFNDTATTEIYTLSLHDALPISLAPGAVARAAAEQGMVPAVARPLFGAYLVPFEITSILLRSEEHTSELQSLAYLVCRLLLEKKKPTLGNDRLAINRGTVWNSDN